MYPSKYCFTSGFLPPYVVPDGEGGGATLMWVMGYYLLHMFRRFYLVGEEVKRSMKWLSNGLIKVGAKVAYHGRRGYVHVASAFPLARYYQAVFGWGPSNFG